mgnify:CR=1 FL=1
MCVKCCMDTSDRDIVFDEKGICNYCIEFTKKEIDRRAAVLHPGKAWIYYNLKKAGEGKKYDCLLGLSGGVDSSTCLHYLIENGIRPLCFSVDNGWQTKEADENIMRMVETLKVPFYRYTIDLKEFVDLQIAFVRAGVKNIEIPTDSIIVATAYELADKYNIKCIISGGNHATECIMPKSFGYDARDLKHIKAIFKKFMGRELKNLPTMSSKKYLYYRFIKRIKVINLLDFYEYNREKSIKLLQEQYGYKPYGEKHGESVFTQWFQNYYLPVKFGIDKRRPHLSSMINSGQITKEEALEELKKPLMYPDFVNEEFRDKVLTYPKHEYTDYPTNEWIWEKSSKIYGINKRFQHVG